MYVFNVVLGLVYIALASFTLAINLTKGQSFVDVIWIINSIIWCTLYMTLL